MSSLLRALRIPEVLLVLPSGAVALVIAELFYKFHSFTLECLAFLGTWYVLDLALRPTVEAVMTRTRRGFVR
jgi:hypothetical protein